MFLHITSLMYLEDYRLRLHFNDGTVKDVDLQQELDGEIFQPLQDIGLFKQVKINPDTATIEWPNGADFAPECLHKIGREVRKIA